MIIFVRKFAESDIATRVEWINNSSINTQMYFDIPALDSNTLEWFYSVQKNRTRMDFTFRGSNNLCVAMSGITDIDFINGNTEFYVMVNPATQGQGYGSKVTKWTINYAFLKFNLNKVYLYTDHSNTKAISIYEKIGFIKEGVFRKHKYKNGVFQDRIFYGLLKEEWLKQEWSLDKINLEFDVN